jgi:hypothetical protein
MCEDFRYKIDDVRFQIFCDGLRIEQYCLIFDFLHTNLNTAQRMSPHNTTKFTFSTLPQKSDKNPLLYFKAVA